MRASDRTAKETHKGHRNEDSHLLWPRLTAARCEASENHVNVPWTVHQLRAVTSIFHGAAARSNSQAASSSTWCTRCAPASSARSSLRCKLPERRTLIQHRYTCS